MKEDPLADAFVGGVRVKICGLARREDALLAAREGADYLGVILVPGSPRALAPEEGRRIMDGLGLPVVGVIADLPVGEAVRAGGALGASVLQLHGEESPEDAAALREAGSWSVWKALRLRGPQDLKEGLARYRGSVDALLLDGWHPGQRGGTGTAFPWSAVEELGSAFAPGLPIIAAGGLTPDNVGEAVRRLRPAMVDVSSGVERSPGVKDAERVRAFIQAVRAAQARPPPPPPRAHRRPVD